MTSETTPLRVLVVAGSLREASLNGRLARLAAAGLRDLGAEAVVYDALRAVEPFDEDSEGTGETPGAVAFQQAVAEADAVFVATPEYNASIPGVLKNAFDWASRAPEAPFRDLPSSALFGTPFAVVSASTGQFGGVWARDETIKALRTQGGRAVTEPAVAVPSAHTAFAEDGALTNVAVTERLGELLAALLEQAALVRTARAAASAPA